MFAGSVVIGAIYTSTLFFTSKSYYYKSDGVNPPFRVSHLRGCDKCNFCLVALPPLKWMPHRARLKASYFLSVVKPLSCVDYNSYKPPQPTQNYNEKVCFSKPLIFSGSVAPSSEGILVDVNQANKLGLISYSYNGYNDYWLQLLQCFHINYIW